MIDERFRSNVADPENTCISYKETGGEEVTTGWGEQEVCTLACHSRSIFILYLFIYFWQQ